MRIFLLMLPWLELFTLIQLGIHTSALTAMLYVLVTLILGIMILQRQGRGMFERLRQAQEGRTIGPELFLDDMAMGFAGLLLMIPGMISDARRPDRGDRPAQAQGRIRTLGVAGRCGQNRPGAPQPRDYRGRLSPPG